MASTLYRDDETFHDACARVYSVSKICHRIRDDPAATMHDGSYLIGDGAYPLGQYLLTPFKEYSNLPAPERFYNYCLSSARSVIERAFGLMKGKFQRLKMIEFEDVSKITHFIHSITALHNFCIIEREVDLKEDFEVDEMLNANGDEMSEEDRQDRNILRAIGSKPEDFKRYRDEIVNELYLDFR